MNITFTDYIVCGFFIPLIYAFLVPFARRKYGWGITAKHFIWGFTVKLIGAIGIGLVYEYYYRFGDTFGYYRAGKFFSEIIKRDSREFMNVMLWGNHEYFSVKAYEFGFSSWYAFSPATVATARLCALINFISFQLYLPTALFFALFSFSGLWKLYRVFTELFPSLQKELAIFILFMPSLFFWGSGIMKDTITIGALGWLTYACYNLFIKKTKRLSSILIGAISLYLMYQIKPYIAMAYLPAVFAWVVFSYTKKIVNRTMRQFILMLFLVMVGVGFILMGASMGAVMEQLAIDNIMQQAASTQQNIRDFGGAGSGYSLGTFEPGVGGLFKIMFPSIIVTLYRPFIWEIGNPFSLLSALESSFFIWFTFIVFRRVGFKKVFSTIVSQPVVLYCLTFAIMFAIPVGIASQNFGTLVRYKIPCIPFYLIGFSLIHYYNLGEGVLIKKNSLYNRPVKAAI